MLRKGYVARLAISWAVLSGGFVLALGGFIIQNVGFWLIGTLIAMSGAAIVAYTEMRRITEALGR